MSQTSTNPGDTVYTSTANPAYTQRTYGMDADNTDDEDSTDDET